MVVWVSMSKCLQVITLPLPLTFPLTLTKTLAGLDVVMDMDPPAPVVPTPTWPIQPMGLDVVLGVGSAVAPVPRQKRYCTEVDP